MTPRKLDTIVSHGITGYIKAMLGDGLDVPALLVDGGDKEHAPPEDLHRNK